MKMLGKACVCRVESTGMLGTSSPWSWSHDLKVPLVASFSVWRDADLHQQNGLREWLDLTGLPTAVGGVHETIYILV